MIRKIEKLFFLFIGLFKDYSFLKIEQKKNFNKYNLDYDQAEKLINNIKIKVIDKNYNMSSEHLKLFAGLSLNFSFNKILEIGTYNGINALILSSLFPNADIDTIDLDDEDQNFFSLYNRKNLKDKNEFIKKRDLNISKSNKINFRKMNSINLINDDQKKYDLIWIDGFHGNPTVTIDIINSIKLIKDDGFIICDDVYLYGDSYNPYVSNATFKTLEELKKNKIIKYDLFLKRIDKNSNIFPKEKKFIAIVKK